MRTHFAHIQINVQPSNLPFYQDLMAFLGWQIIFGNEEMLGVAGKSGDSLWFVGQVKDVRNDYDGPGMNHMGIGASTTEDVDAVTNYIREKGLEPLFETPRHRPEFAHGDDHTYYQVMFETPDHLLLEVVYTGPKAA